MCTASHTSQNNTPHITHTQHPPYHTHTPLQAHGVAVPHGASGPSIIGSLGRWLDKGVNKLIGVPDDAGALPGGPGARTHAAGGGNVGGGMSGGVYDGHGGVYDGHAHSAAGIAMVGFWFVYVFIYVFIYVFVYVFVYVFATTMCLCIVVVVGKHGQTWSNIHGHMSPPLKLPYTASHMHNITHHNTHTHTHRVTPWTAGPPVEQAPPPLRFYIMGTPPTSPCHLTHRGPQMHRGPRVHRGHTQTTTTTTKCSRGYLPYTHTPAPPPRHTQEQLLLDRDTHKRAWGVGVGVGGVGGCFHHLGAWHWEQ